jgi:D-alanyl-D-alanine carboxypeptidase
MRLTRFAPLIVALLVLGLAGPAAAASTRQEQVQRSVDRVVAAGVPGAIALVREGDRTIRVSSGYADVATRTPMRVGDRFRVGSLTKTYVGVVVLQLVGEDRLSLDDTVERWLPGLVPHGQGITVGSS